MSMPDAPTTRSEARQRLLALRAAQLRKDGRTAGIATEPGRTSAPATPAQCALWFLDRLHGASALYNTNLAVHLTGTLDVERLSRALRLLARRHGSLRTAFEMHGDEVRQCVAPAEAIEHAFDLTPVAQADVAAPGDAAADSQSRLERSLRAFAEQPFDLEAAPLARARLLRLATHEHVLQIVVHHAVTDGWSMAVLASDLGTLYEGLATAPSAITGAAAAATPPELPLQFVDYAAWLSSPQRQKAIAADIDYWRTRLAGVAPLPLATDRPRPAHALVRGTVHRFTLDHALAARARAHAKARGATLFMVLLAAFKAVLARYANETDVAVGTPVAGRDRPELEGLIGYFVNSITLRSTLDPAAGFDALLDTVRDTVVEGLAHQVAPFDAVVNALNVPRDASRNPIYQISFALNNQPRPVFRMQGLETRLHPVATGTSKFDLSLTFEGHDDVLAGAFEYATDLFDAGTIERLASHYRRLLAAALDDPGQPLARLPLMDPAEHRLVVAGFNATDADYPLAQCLPQLIEAQVARTPHAVAVVDGNRKLSFAQLNARANRIAHRLRALGVRPDDRVGVSLRRGAALPTALLGVFKAGAAYVPIDPDAPADRRRFIVEDAGIRIMLGTEPDGRLGEHLLWLDPADPSLEALPDANPPAGAGPSDLAYVIYTSGSTGQPKGVLIEHRGLVNNVCWQIREFGFDASDRFLQWTTFTFDASIWEIWTPMVIGAAQILADEQTMRDPAQTLRLIRDARATVAAMVPGFLSAILTELERGAPAGQGLPLRLMFVGGEALELADARRWATLYDIELVNTYGPTETTVDATFNRDVQRMVADPTICTIPIGRPIANTRVYIVDALLQPVPLGVVGELYIASAGIARGYLNRPELTAQRFVPDPFCTRDGARLYRSGDLGRFRPDGSIEFFGRVDHQVKLRGYRIELGEIEAALGADSGVDRCLVIVREDQPGDKRLVAYLVPEPTRGEDPALVSRLRAALKARLPAYMVPQHFVLLERIPQLPNGKTDRRALPRPDVDGGPSDGDGTDERPQGPVETRLAAIWAETLGVPSIDPTVSFFDLGGHSLLALRIMHRIEQAFGRQLRLANLFDAPSVRELARLLADGDNAGRGKEGSCAVAIRATGRRAPLFFVSGWGGAILGFNALARALDPQQPLYVLDTGAFDVSKAPVESVEQVAAKMVHDLREVQPQGPYHLCGFSQGGKFVHEVAQQLVASGQEVALLALMDCNAPGYPRQRNGLQRIAANLDRMRRQSLADNLAYVAARLAWFRDRLTRREHALIADDQEVGASAVAQAMQATANAMTAAWRRYTPRYYPGRMLLIRAHIRESYARMIDDDRELGWRGLAGGGIDVSELLCRHNEMVNPEHAEALAGILNDFLPDGPWHLHGAWRAAGDDERGGLSVDEQARGLGADTPSDAAIADAEPTDAQGRTGHSPATHGDRVLEH